MVGGVVISDGEESCRGQEMKRWSNEGMSDGGTGMEED